MTEHTYLKDPLNEQASILVDAQTDVDKSDELYFMMLNDVQIL